MNSDDYEDWFNRVKLTKIGKNLKKSWIFSADSFHLAAKYNPKALHQILCYLKDIQSFKEKFIELYGLTQQNVAFGLYGLSPLHIAAMNSDSISTR